MCFNVFKKVCSYFKIKMIPNLFFFMRAFKQKEIQQLRLICHHYDITFFDNSHIYYEISEPFQAYISKNFLTPNITLDNIIYFKSRLLTNNHKYIV